MTTSTTATVGAAVHTEEEPPVMTQPTTKSLDQILARVQKLIALADHPNTPEAEAENARGRAEAMMLEYRIEEWQISQQASTAEQRASLVPVWRRIRYCPLGSPYSETYRSVIGRCLNHVDAKATGTSEKDETTGEWWYVVEAVGYDSDLRYAELLFTSFALAFGGKMEPKIRPSASDAENAYVLRSAGQTGRQIALALWGREDKAAKSKARRLFAEWAKSLGEDPAPLLGREGASIAAYREAYADGFSSEVYYRLARMRMSSGDSGAVVLKSRKDAVMEEWYNRHPHLRPNTDAPRPAVGDTGGPGGTCPKCRKAKSGYCRDHNWLRPTATRERAFHSAGWDRGVSAAQSVDLGSSGRGRTNATPDRPAVEG